jgi:carbamoyltransferase
VLGFPNRVQQRFQTDARWPEHERAYRDLAASAQQALEYALLRIAIRLRESTGERSLCLAGGVALNSIANQKICAEAGYERVFIIPAAEDSGVAVGAAYLGHWELAGGSPRRQVRTDSYGATATAVSVEAAIRTTPDIRAEQPGDFLEVVVDRLRHGQIGGWFQGGSELGPRALGHRSIICSPCDPHVKDRLNARVKFREAFRPFAPAILADHAPNWFEFGGTCSDSPFMLRVVPFRRELRHQVPAVVHVDGTGRLQTLTAQDNGCFHALVERFYARTGVPILLNTSMNIQSEPIVETPEDALWCLLGTDLDFCVVHDWVVTKREAFGGILDYIPRVIADECSLTLGVERYALRKTIQGDASVTVRTSTPWGRADIVLPLRLLPLLSLIDGQRDGHALCAALADEAAAAHIERDLLLLRRMHIIDFRGTHV